MANQEMTRSGGLVQNLSGELAYFSFKPSPLPPVPPLQIDSQALALLVEANRKVAFLDAISEKIPNLNLFLSMYIRKEALVSSQIEGTQCTLDDVLDPSVRQNANIDVGEVINYIAATDFALKRLDDLPLCARLLKETHAILINEGRGSDKTPGKFRTSQNWIGGQGGSLKNARYIPPNVEDMKAALTDLEKYMNSNDSLDPLVQAALIHYQFETIHPFLDGNGRIGRLLITLFLIHKKIISKPVLYISCFLKINRVEYYDRLGEVRKNGNYEQWVSFFLQMILQTANDAIESINALEALHKKNISLIEALPVRARENALLLFEYIERKAIVDTSLTARELGLSYNTTAKNIELLRALKILSPSSKSGKASLYSYTEYLDILRKGTELYGARMDNILLNTRIELKKGLKARLTRAGTGGSDEKYILILEVVENESARKINLIVSGRKVFDSSGKCLDFGDAYPVVTEHGKIMITKKFISAWLE